MVVKNYDTIDVAWRSGAAVRTVNVINQMPQQQWHLGWLQPEVRLECVERREFKQKQTSTTALPLRHVTMKRLPLQCLKHFYFIQSGLISRSSVYTSYVETNEIRNA